MALDTASFKELGGPGNSELGGQAYSVFSATDTIFNMMTSGYLNDLAGKLHVRDIVLLAASDGSQLVQIASNDGSTVTVTSGNTEVSGNTTIAGTLDVTGLTTLAEALILDALGILGTLSVDGLYVLGQTAQSLSGPGAVNITTRITEFTSTGVDDALTLANATNVGQKKTVIHVVDGGSGILTPTSGLGYSTITFTTAGESVELEWRSGGWAVVGFGGLSASLPAIA